MTINDEKAKIKLHLEKTNAYLASIFKEQKLLSTGELVDSPSLTFQTCAPSALILPLSSFLKLTLECLQNLF